MRAPEKAGVKIIMSLDDAGKGARDYLDGEMDDSKQHRGDVNYRPAEGERPESCGNCAHFEAEPPDTEGSCVKVAGVIDASMVCDLFEPEESPMAAPEEGKRPPPFGGGEEDDDG